MKRAVVAGVVLSVVTVVAVSRAHAERSLSQIRAVPPTTMGLTNPRDTDQSAIRERQAQEPAQTEAMITVIVTLKEQANLTMVPRLGRAARMRSVVRTLQATAAATQEDIIAHLDLRRSEGRVAGVTSFWIFNGLAVTATPDAIEELKARTEVLSVTPDRRIDAPPPLRTQLLLGPSAAEPNLSVVGAPVLWQLGYRGQGIVVANMDTGVDVNHSDLSAQWRGGDNSWFDPNGQHPLTPVDVHGHGTWTMGAMVGGDASGSAVGIAPEAQWIAVKIFNDQGWTTSSKVHQGFQWLLDPDGNPGTADAPHVVSNSWTFSSPGCDLSFQLDLQALRAAGILPVFAAGNFGPASGSSASPGNNPEALAVGATNNSDGTYLYSSRGPSACDEPATIFPEIVAPGVAIRTTDLFGTYYSATGTSLAAPHVAGAIALLLCANPSLSVDRQEAILMDSSLDLGMLGPDNHFGHGRLNVLRAYALLLPYRLYFPATSRAGSGS